MGCEIRKARYLSEISTVRELKEARRELELREWFARERLVEDVYGTFTLDNLLSMIAPPGSLLDRMIGGVGTGFSVVQAVLGTLGSLIGGRRTGTTTRKPAARAATRGATRSATTPGTVTRKRPASPASSRASHKSAARSVSKTASRPAARKRTPEIEVEVELEEKKTAARAAKR